MKQKENPVVDETIYDEAHFLHVCYQAMNEHEGDNSELNVDLETAMSDLFEFYLSKNELVKARRVIATMFEYKLPKAEFLERFLYKCLYS